MDIKIGDIVGRKSYGCDIIFKVHNILTGQNGKRTIILKGINIRILADAPESDIVRIPDSKVKEEVEAFSRKIDKLSAKAVRNRRTFLSHNKPRFMRGEGQIFKRPGRVLHLDGDKEYLQMCLDEYKKYNIEVVGKVIPEAEQPKNVYSLLAEYNPDILVVTGHDGLLRNGKDYTSLESYRNSKYYVESVKEARKFEPSLDDLVIFAGACQSYYEAILAAGANFASSPDRVLIHALDPVMICQQIALAPIDKILPLEATLKNTITGIKGIGGVQTRGKYRDGMPKTSYVL